MTPDGRPALPRRSVLIGLAVLAGPAAAAPTGAPPLPPEVATELPGAAWRGAATLRAYGFHIADIRLWSPAPMADDYSGQPLALALTYARRLPGPRIASRSIGEMRRIGPFSAEQATRWEQAMGGLFPDVQPGDRLTGVQRPGETARFYFNGQWRGEVAEADFARLFFGIWLSPRSSDPTLRRQLLGGSS